jgi:hypothetical protein
MLVRVVLISKDVGYPFLLAVEVDSIAFPPMSWIIGFLKKK